jgi:hypothetical protein
LEIGPSERRHSSFRRAEGRPGPNQCELPGRSVIQRDFK